MLRFCEGFRWRREERRIFKQGSNADDSGGQSADASNREAGHEEDVQKDVSELRSPLDVHCGKDCGHGVLKLLKESLKKKSWRHSRDHGPRNPA